MKYKIICHFLDSDDGARVPMVDDSELLQIVTDMPHKFRLLDDDDNVYFEGYADDCNSEDAFAPLDDYGMPLYGCTSIQFLKDSRKRTIGTVTLEQIIDYLKDHSIRTGYEDEAIKGLVEELEEELEFSEENGEWETL